MIAAALCEMLVQKSDGTPSFVVQFVPHAPPGSVHPLLIKLRAPAG
jgi:hypothetical protein